MICKSFLTNIQQKQKIFNAQTDYLLVIVFVDFAISFIVHPVESTNCHKKKSACAAKHDASINPNQFVWRAKNKNT